MYDLGDSGGQKWIISPESEQQRLSSFGVGQTIVAALRETDTAASGLSSASTRYEVVIYDKVTGREVAVAFDEEIATADIRAEPEIVAVSISDTVFVTWPFVWDHSDAVTRAFSRDGSQLWSIESLALGDSNQHFAVFSSGSIEGVIHLDSSREIAHDIVGDFYRYPSFNACSSRVFGIGEGNAHYVVDAVSGARIDTTERIKAVAPLGAYFGPSEESPSIRYEALGPEETRTVWETPADTSIFKDWLVEGGVVIIGTYSAGEQAVDPFTGVVSAYDGSIRVPGNQWKVFPDWVVDITGLTVEPNRLASDCPVFQVPFTAADSFPVFSP